MNNFMKVLLGVGLSLLEQSEQSTKKTRNRAADNMNDLRDLAHEKYETATDRMARASRAIRGEDNQAVGNVLRLAAGVGVGIAIGLLLAPASGEETRNAIADKVHVVGGEAKRRFSSEELGATGTNG